MFNSYEFFMLTEEFVPISKMFACFMYRYNFLNSLCGYLLLCKGSLTSWRTKYCKEDFTISD